MKKQNFNENWMFMKDEKGAKPQAVTLPHDAMIHENRDKDAPTGMAGAYFPGGSYVYTKKFVVPAEAAGERWLVEFEGAYLDSYVYLNKCYVMANHSGNKGFVADLTPYLKYGAQNTLEVRVKNDAMVNARWYTGSGIYRPVWLYQGGSVRMPLNGVRITTPEVEPEVSKVVVRVAIENELPQTKTVRLDILLKDADGHVAGKENYPVTLFPGESPVITCSLYVRDGRLWSVDTPNLYTCEVKILDGENILDSAEETFGIRHIQMDPVKGLRINDKRVLLRGSCVHHDHGILGAAGFLDAEERKVRISKEAGFNALRIAHQSSSKALLNACDKYGMLLLEESFDQWHQLKTSHDYTERFDREWEEEVEAIVAKDFNHPCVFMYSIGNEILELGRPDGIRTSRMLVDKFRQLDPTRPVTNAVNGGMIIDDRIYEILADIGAFTKEQLSAVARMMSGEDTEAAAPSATVDINEFMTMMAKYNAQIMAHRIVGERQEEVCSHLDVCGYNYMMGRYQIDMQEHPNRMIFGSETNPPKIDQLWDYTLKYPSCLGDFTWTGWDYIGESGIGITRYNEKKTFGEDYPVYLAYCGDMDITGYRMPISYFREIVFGLRKAPYVSVQDPQHFADEPSNTPWAIAETFENWTWPGYETKSVKVTVFSASEKVVLLCNGKIVGEAACGAANGFKAVIETIYEPGELCAVGYTDDKEDGRFTLRTAGEEVQLNVHTTKTVLAADGSEISYVEIALTDANGVVHYGKDRRVSLKTEGGIALEGFGSADPWSTENFFDDCRTTYHGRVLAVIRGIAAGAAALEISAEGCESTVVALEVQ